MPFTDAYSTSTSTSPSPGVGASTSSTWGSASYSETATTFIDRIVPSLLTLLARLTLLIGVRLESQSRPEYGIVVLPVTQDQQVADDGLRSRKKEKTRRAIEDAALDLFAEQGYEATTVDEIAERAEVSKATFFRYFATKGEVVFGRGDDGHDDLRAAIVARPPGEDDLTVVRRALQHDWTHTLDPERTTRQARAARTSPMLRGLSFDLGMAWQRAIAEALARRHGLDHPDQRARLVASVAFAALSNAVNHWLDGGGSADLGAAIDHSFVLLADVGGAFARA
jgi:AcrR family transcriptional regulator